MISDEVSIYNLALNAIGARNNVILPTEKSREAEVCHLWYTVVRDAVLAAAHWPSARAFQRLALLTQRPDAPWVTGDPDPEFMFAFSTPADMLRPRYMSNYARFSLSSFGPGQIAINSNDPQPILIYTSRQTAISLWDSELQFAIVYGLAAHICQPLTGKRTLAREILQKANSYIMQAQQGAANTDDNRHDAIPDWIAARGYIAAQLPSQYLYPYGSMLTLGDISVG